MVRIVVHRRGLVWSGMVDNCIVDFLLPTLLEFASRLTGALFHLGVMWKPLSLVMHARCCSNPSNTI